MALRKAAAYTKRKVVPFTRTSKKRTKSFVKTIPPSKIVKFEMGNSKGYGEGAFPYKVTVVAAENAQIRHNALEACRQFVNKKLEKEFPKQYFFKIVPFPHHIQRENKMLTGAGSDRMQTGMQLSYGKPSGKSAILKKGSEIFIVAVVSEKALRFAVNALKKVKPKIACKVRYIYETRKKAKEQSA